MQYHRARLFVLFTLLHYVDVTKLGTGTGVVSIALGALRSIIQGSGAEGAIIATDLGTKLLPSKPGHDS